MLLLLLLLVVNCLFTFVAEIQERAIAVCLPCYCVVCPRRCCLVAEVPEITLPPTLRDLRLPYGRRRSRRVGGSVISGTSATRQQRRGHTTQ